MNKHETYIQECFKLAKQAINPSPNPLVGSVIVKNDKIIAKGFHKGSGLPHAELDAINNAKESLISATLYCNLEPCCHTNKKTPPCAQRIIKEGIKKVVISNLDPNPAVAGKGVQLLREAGIEVITDILTKEGEELNEVFFYHIVHKLPFVHLKMAQTLDGKMATLSGDSKWITNEEARSNVHRQRNMYDAILVGASTAIKDNPKLTVRLNDTEKAIQRVILSNGNDIPKNLQLFTDEFKEKTIVLSTKDKSLKELLKEMYTKHQIYSLYVEGGAKTISSFLTQNLYQKISIYIAPKILGQGKAILEENSPELINESIELSHIQWQSFGDNQMISARNI